MRFYSGKSIGEGIGMGLAIAYSAINADGGEVEAHSEENKGTTITVRLPIHTSSTNEKPSTKLISDQSDRDI